MKRALGFDSSKYDLYLRPTEKCEEDIDLIILRTGYGMMEDGIFLQSAKNIDHLTAAKMAYHYFSSGAKWREQIDRHLEICDKAPWVPAFHWIDFESAYNEMGMKFAEECVMAIEYLIKWHKKAGVYTNLNLYNHYFGPAAGNVQYPLWLSWPIDAWSNTPDIHKYRPILPNLRDDWDIWQYSYRGDGTVYGAGRSYAFDLNVYHGSPAELAAWLHVDQEPDTDLYKQGYDAALSKMQIFLHSIKF